MRMKKPLAKRIMSAGMAFIMAFSTAAPAFAAETDGQQSIPVELSQEATVFKVSLPTSLPVTVDANHNIVTATDTAITNNSYGPVQIKGIRVEDANGWTLTSFDTDFRKVKVDSKEYGLQIQGANVDVSGDGDTSVFGIINGYKQSGLAYDAVVAAQSNALSETMANVIFTIGWFGTDDPDTPAITYQNVFLDADFVDELGLTQEQTSFAIPATYTRTASPMSTFSLNEEENVATTTASEVTYYRFIGISSLAFDAYDNLQEISVPSSITTIVTDALAGCDSLQKVFIDAPTDSIAGAPWGAVNDTIEIIWNDTQSGGEVGVTGVSLDTHEISGLTVGSSQQLTATVTPADASDKSVRWYSNSDAVTVDQAGLVTAVSVGTATITVETNDGAFTDICTVTVIGQTSNTLTITAENRSLVGYSADASGLTLNIPNTVTDDQGTEYTITAIDAGAFANCSNLTGLNIQSDTITIGQGAFENCDNLNNVMIMSDVAEIGTSAFEGCTNLNNLNIDSMTGPSSIGSRAFADCTNLSNVNLKEGVTSIADDAFEGCTNLTSIWVSAEEGNISGSAPWGATNATVAYQSLYVSAATGSLIGYTDSTTTLDIPSGITDDNGTWKNISGVAANGFEGCNNLETVTMSGVKALKTRAFANCVNLSEIHINGVQMNGGYIASDAFEGVDGITIYINMEENAVSGAPWGATNATVVWGQTALTADNLYDAGYTDGMSSFTIPSNMPSTGAQIVRIADNTFSACDGLTSVTIPTSIWNIESNAFAGCDGISITIDGQECWNTKYGAPWGATNATVQYATPHEWGDGEELVAASDTQCGQTQYTCSLCGQTKIEYTHTFDTSTWAYDADGHWNTDIEGHDVKGNYCSHSLNSAVITTPTETTPGTVNIWCSTCAYTDTRMISYEDMYITITAENRNLIYSEGSTDLFVNNMVTVDGINRQVVAIADGAFADCTNLVNVNIWLNGSIGSGAFANCTNLSNVMIGDQVTDIASDAFSGCEQSSLMINIQNEEGSIANEPWGANNATINYNRFYINSTNRYLAGYTDDTVDYNVPSNVQIDESTNKPVDGVSAGAFENCDLLETVTFTNWVQAIKSRAFADCDNLREIHLQGVNTIASDAFAGVDGIIIYINAETDSVAGAPWGATNATVVWTQLYITPSNYDLIGYTEGDTTVNIPASVVVNGENITVMGIGSNAFAGTDIQTVNIAEGVSNIRSGAFSNCSQLNYVSIPSTITWMPVDAFSGCEGLTIYINNEPGSVSNAPWGATNANIVYGVDKRAYLDINFLTNSPIGPSSVTEVEFTQAIPGSYTSTWTADQSGEGAITCYLDGTKVYVYLNEAYNEIFLPDYSYGVFNNCSSLTTINGLSYLNTSKAGNMSWFFGNCSSLSYLDLSTFDTSRAYDMNYMFSGCSNLTGINFGSNFTTASVNNMNGMFNSCSKLNNLDLSGFVTTNVNDMSWMFANCDNLTTLDLSSFDTSNVQNTSYMFYSDEALSTIYISALWTMSSVTSSDQMFNMDTLLRNYDSNYVDASKAHGGSDGYLTINCAHVYDEGVATNVGTSDICQTITYTCTICGTTMVNNTVHTMSSNVIQEADSEHCETTRHSCDICGYYYDEITGHGYSTVWSSNETEHWHDDAEGHGLKADVASHNYAASVAQEADAEHCEVTRYTCSDCGYFYEETTAHSYSDTWTSNSEQHWHEDVEGHGLKSDVGTHNFVASVAQVADDEHCEVTRYTCADCGYFYEEVTAHSYSTVWTSSETHHWHVDVEGHDGKGQYEEHSWNEGVDAEVDGVLTTTYTCTECGRQNVVTYTDFTVTASNRSEVGYTSSTTELVIPEKFTGSDGVAYRVVGIGEGAFKYCSKLTSVSIPDSVTSIGKQAFYYCNELGNVVIPSTVESIEESTFYGCSYLTNIDIPNGVATIGANAFYGCMDLTSINIPDSVTEIGNGAFYNCNKLNSVRLSENIASISDWTFSDCSSLLSITIPSSVTSIGTRAFSGTGLVNLTIPENVISIGYYAFANCSSLTSIDLPNNITTIESDAFSQCAALTDITVLGPECTFQANGTPWGASNATVAFEQGEHSFDAGVVIQEADETHCETVRFTCAGCGYSYDQTTHYFSDVWTMSETQHWHADVEGHDGKNDLASHNMVTTVIQEMDAGHCEVTRYTCSVCGYYYEEISAHGYSTAWSSNETEHWHEDVEGHGLKSDVGTHNFVASVVQVADDEHCEVTRYTCSDCGYFYEEVTAHSYSTVWTSSETHHWHVDVEGHNVKGQYEEHIWDEGTDAEVDGVLTTTYTCTECGRQRAIVYTDFTVSADNRAAVGYAGIDDENLVIPATFIGTGENGTEAGVKYRVTVIGYNAFNGCTELTNVTIPESVTSIRDSAFGKCSSLTSVTIPEGVTSIGGLAFSGCTNLTSVTIPASVISIGDRAFLGCNGVNGIVVASENTVYDSRNNCNAIIETGTNTLVFGCKTTVIPVSVASIGDRAFYYCTGLTSVTIPEGVTSIENNAFRSCTSLTSVIIPESVTSIGAEAFRGCNLTSVTLPSTVTSIGDQVFEECYNLVSVTIPESVTSIEQAAFWNCTSLTDINFGGTQEQWDAITKGSNWNYNTGSYTIHCTDGDIAKS